MEAAAGDKPFSRILLKRVAAFFLAVSVFSLLFWVAGNWSGFLDETQLMLIGVVRWSSIPLVLLSLLGALLSLFRAPARGFVGRLAAFAGYLLLALLGLAIVLVSQLLGVAATGV